MKREIGVEKPSYLRAAWPGKYETFSWLEYAINIPYPIYVITTYKENGKPNACLHSWGCMGGDRKGYYSVLTTWSSGHTYENILRSGEWCVNFPSLGHHQACMGTVENNDLEDDEIASAGLTVERSKVIAAPRIAECLINLECRLEWHKPFSEDSSWCILTGRIVHTAIDDTLFELDPGKRMQVLRTMYNVRSTLNPLTGKVGPASQPVIGVP